MSWLKHFSPGWVLLFVIATLCIVLQQTVIIGNKHFFEATVLAIVFGIGVRNLDWLPEPCLPGVVHAEKFLALGIVLLGAGLNLTLIGQQGPHILMIVITTLCVSFALIWILGRVFQIPGALSLLLAVGTTICGTTAIAVIAPLIKAPQEETSYAVGTVALCGLMALLVYPMFGHFWGVSDLDFGIFAGTAIHSTPQVVGAGFLFSDAAGQTATAVKLVRNCFIAPLALLIAFLYSREKTNAIKAFPWFLFGYFALAWLSTSGLLGEQISKILFEAGKFFVLLGMVGIGLNTNLRSFTKVGFKPLLVGVLGSLVVAAVSIGFINMRIGSN